MRLLILISFVLFTSGCNEGVLKRSWHDRFGWEPGLYFKDPKVIALCNAIETNDIDEMKRLIKLGVNINAKGKGNMTPLLWAFPGNQLDRFKLLLEAGADPNVLVSSNFGVKGWISPGSSVTHMACKTSFFGYFEAVFTNGGDPNLIQMTKALGRGDVPLFSVILGSSPDKAVRVQILIDAGANLNYHTGGGSTAARWAVGTGHYDIILMLLHAGADHKISNPGTPMRLIHGLAKMHEAQAAYWSPQHKKKFDNVVKLLESKGESLQRATADYKRWASWSISSGEYKRKMAAEFAAMQNKNM